MTVLAGGRGYSHDSPIFPVCPNPTAPDFARVSSTASLLEDVSAPTMFERADGNWGDALELAQRGVRQVPAWRWLLT